MEFFTWEYNPWNFFVIYLQGVKFFMKFIIF